MLVLKEIILELGVGLDAAVDAFGVVGELALEAGDDDVHLCIFVFPAFEELLDLAHVDVFVFVGLEVGAR